MLFLKEKSIFFPYFWDLRSFPFCVLSNLQTVMSVWHIWDVIAFLMILDMLGQFFPFQEEASCMNFWSACILDTPNPRNIKSTDNSALKVHLCQLIVFWGRKIRYLCPMLEELAHRNVIHPDIHFGLCCQIWIHLPSDTNNNSNEHHNDSYDLSCQVLHL